VDAAAWPLAVGDAVELLEAETVAPATALVSGARWTMISTMLGSGLLGEALLGCSPRTSIKAIAS